MFFFYVIIITLPFVSYTNGRAISPSNSAWNEEQDEMQVQIPSSLEGDEINRAHIGPDDLMKILTNGNSDRTHSSEENNEENSTLRDENLRKKRSFYPYTTEYQMPWPKFEGPNNWRSNRYSIQSPYFVSMNELEAEKPSFNSKYTYYNNADSKSKTTKIASPTKTTSAPLELSMDSAGMDSEMTPILDSSETQVVAKKPVWDLTAYRPSNMKSPRLSRAWKRELTPEIPSSPFFILEESQESQRFIHLNNEYMERNEIPSFPFSMPRTPTPSKCAWAIISCCSSSSEDINHKCFREMECEEKFWNTQLCSDEFKRASMETASNFYKGKF